MSIVPQLDSWDFLQEASQNRAIVESKVEDAGP